MSIIINQGYIKALKQYWIKVEFDCQLWECKDDFEFKNRQQLLYEIKDIKEL